MSEDRQRLRAAGGGYGIPTPFSEGMAKDRFAYADPASASLKRDYLAFFDKLHPAEKSALIELHRERIGSELALIQEMVDRVINPGPSKHRAVKA